jgi:hypothetical protein
VAFVAALAVLLSGTRTFLFAGPAILLAASVLGGGNASGRVRNLALGAGIVGLAAWAAPSLLSADAQGAIRLTFESLLTGDFEADDSLRLRLLNLSLAELTLSAAPFRGVVTRDFMRPEDVGGVDSEYLLTFHRYGAIGIGLLLATSWCLWSVARESRVTQPSLSRWLALTVAVGLLYGVTQGALINTRVGVLPFLLAGLAAAAHRTAVRQSAPN